MTRLIPMLAMLLLLLWLLQPLLSASLLLLGCTPSQTPA
jgi:predicted Na+-dependent transporter